MGLFKKAAKSAAVMGAAKMVVGAVSKRMANRQQETTSTATQQQQNQPQGTASPAGVAAAPAAPIPASAQQAPDSSLGGQLQQLANLRDQGVLSADEFTAAKARLLGT
jgi:hypothetical protein